MDMKPQFSTPSSLCVYLVVAFADGYRQGERASDAVRESLVADARQRLAGAGAEPQPGEARAFLAGLLHAKGHPDLDRFQKVEFNRA